MENESSFENREIIITSLLAGFAEREGMTLDDVSCDIVLFAPVEQNPDPNTEYLAEVAEAIGISYEEMLAYAIKKAQEHWTE